MFFIDLGYNDGSGFIVCPGRNFQHVGVAPQMLGVSEIYAVPGQILSAFVRIELEIHNGIVNIPFLHGFQGANRQFFKPRCWLWGWSGFLK